MDDYWSWSRTRRRAYRTARTVRTAVPSAYVANCQALRCTVTLVLLSHSAVRIVAVAHYRTDSSDDSGSDDEAE